MDTAVCKETKICQGLQLEHREKVQQKDLFSMSMHKVRFMTFAAPLMFLTQLPSYSKLKGSVNTEGCVFVMREKRQKQ